MRCRLRLVGVVGKRDSQAWVDSTPACSRMPVSRRLGRVAGRKIESLAGSAKVPVTVACRYCARIAFTTVYLPDTMSVHGLSLFTMYFINSIGSARADATKRSRSPGCRFMLLMMLAALGQSVAL